MAVSARGRITAVAVGLACLCLGAGGLALDGVVQRALIAQVDDALVAEARLYASTIEQEGRYLDLEFGDLDMRDFDTKSPRAYLQLWRGETTVYSSRSLGQATLTPFSGTLQAPLAQWLTAPDGSQARAVGVRFAPRLDSDDDDDDDDDDDEHDRKKARPAEVVLVLARDVGPTIQAIQTMRQALVGVGSLTLLVLGLALWWGVRSAFRPVETAAAEIAQIGGGELSRRLSSEGLPRELLPVVERTNGLLARLEQTFQRERAFSQEVAHELRTPISGLRAIFEVSLRRERDAAHYREVVQDGLTILIQVQRMVENLLRLARLEAGGQELQSSAVDVNEVLLNAWAAFGPAASERRLSITWDLASEAVAQVDPGLLEVVARNLVENAVSYADEGGALTIRTVATDNGLGLQVENTGSALTQEQAQAATQRFWRGDEARTVGEHCGLGLALVERSLQALGGSLELRSEPGGSFQAEVTLPA